MKEFIRNSLESIDYQIDAAADKPHLLICSSYDAYILEEDGRLEASINQEYYDLNLTHMPIFVRVGLIPKP